MESRIVITRALFDEVYNNPKFGSLKDIHNISADDLWALLVVRLGNPVSLEMMIIAMLQYMGNTAYEVELSQRAMYT